MLIYFSNNSNTISPKSTIETQVHHFYSFTFVWGGKHPCPKRNILCTPVPSGGMGVPDILAYYKATILDQIKVWWNPTQQIMWLKIEMAALAS